MPSLYFNVCLFLAMLLFAGICAFLETAFTSLRLFKLKELESSVAQYKFLFNCWEKNPQRILITILIANNFAHVLCSVTITEIMHSLFGGFGLAFGVMIATVMILIFGDIFPKTLAKTHHEHLFASTLWLINGLVRLFYPIVSVLLKLAEFFFARFGGPHILEHQDSVSEKEIEFLIDYSDEKGIMETEKTVMLQNIFGLGQTPVSKIMIPETDMALINVDSTLDQAMNALSKFRYSRLPVFEGREDNIIGIIYHKDVFHIVSNGQSKPLRDIVRPVLFIPETKKSNQLLSEFLKKRMHMAIVIDEYGGIVGLITLEDLIEEIVGEISDEHEKIHTGIIPLEQGGWLVDAGIGLDKLEQLLHIKFVVEDSVTLAGFLAEKLQHLPKKGERILYQGFYFQVQQAGPRRVFQVLVFEDKQEAPRVDID